MAPPRTGAPITLLGTLSWVGGGTLAEGRVRTDVISRGERGDRVVSEELVVTPQGTRFRVVLPPLTDDPWQVTVRMDFLPNGGGRYPLGEYAVRPRQQEDRTFVTLVCDDALGRDLDLAGRFDPTGFVVEHSRGGVRMLSGRVDPLAFPRDPLELFGADLAVVTGTALARFDRRQRAALLAWVRAGGATCLLVPPGGVPDPDVADLLRELTLARGGVPDFGEPDDDAAAVEAGPFGLGVAAVVRDAPESFAADDPPDGWTDTLASLWRIRPAVAAAADGGWEMPEPAKIEDPNPYSYQYNANAGQQFFTPWRSKPATVSQGATDALLPREIRFVPPWLIVAALLGYVLLIGGDYFLLGRRWRKFTWVTFPLLTLAVAGGMVATSNAYLGVTDVNRRLSIIDVDADGTPLRATVLEFRFAGTNRDVAAETRTALAAVPDVRTKLNSWNNYGVEQTPTDHLSAVGRFPVGYDRILRLAQWDPRLTRLTVLEPEAVAELGPVPELDWAALSRRDPEEEFAGTVPADTALFAVTTDGLRKLGGANIDARRELSEIMRPAEEMVVFTPGRPFVPGLSTSNVTDPFPKIFDDGSGAFRQNGTVTSWNGELKPRSFLHRITVAPEAGLFRFVSRVAPQGGGTFEDLTLMTAGDDAWVVVAVVERPDGYAIYRHLIEGE